MMKQEEKTYCFGWVSSDICANFSQWSSWKKHGDTIDADRFYAKTYDEAQEQGLTWFCTEVKIFKDEN